ncbi:MAG: hypothetical protein AAFP69_15730, partial [Planctomycetota bacterium]
NIGHPQWTTQVPRPMLRDSQMSASFLVESKGFVDSMIVCGHVATGALILGFATVQVMKIARVRHLQTRHPQVR